MKRKVALASVLFTSLALASITLPQISRASPNPLTTYRFGPDRTSELSGYEYLAYKDQSYAEQVNQLFEVNFISYINYWGSEINDGAAFSSTTDTGYSSWANHISLLAPQVIAQIAPVQKIIAPAEFTTSQTALVALISTYKELITQLSDSIVSGSIFTNSGQTTLNNYADTLKVEMTTWIAQYFKDSKLPSQSAINTPSFRVGAYVDLSTSKITAFAELIPTSGFDPILNLASTYDYQWYLNNNKTKIDEGSIKVGVNPFDRVRITTQAGIHIGEKLLFRVRADNSSGAGLWSNFVTYVVKL